MLLTLPTVSAWVLYLAAGIEIIAAVLIGFASLQCALAAAGLLIRRDASTVASVRLQFGLWLSLAIEFELAADILRTTVAPGWDEIGKLAAIVLLRTVLNYFLQLEIRGALKNSADAGSLTSPITRKETSP